MRATLRDDDTFDGRATTRARLPLLVIDTHVIVVVASFPPQVAILAERRSAMLDGLRQHRDYSFV